MVDYANDLFGAMQEIVQATISKVNFDRTDIYTIVERVENKENWYKVTNGQYTFEARATNIQEY